MGAMNPPTREDLVVSWVEDDHGRDLITIVDTRVSPPAVLVELSPLDALSVAGQMLSLARDALMAQSAMGAIHGQSMPVDAPADLGRVLRQVRKERGVSAAALAEHLGVVGPTIISAELGTRHPRLPLLLSLLKALGYRLAVIRR